MSHLGDISRRSRIDTMSRSTWLRQSSLAWIGHQAALSRIALCAHARDRLYFDVLVVHRDAERQTVDDRLAEIRAALQSAALEWHLIPVIPVRMTEAWLLLDESAIRLVAGRPTGTEPLNLPSVAQVEAEPDPKSCLQEVLATASGLSGRRLV